MTTITIHIPDERLNELRERAARLNMSPEEFVWATVVERLDSPMEDFQHAVDYVLKKNQALYKRLG
ncbi:MAG: DNA-binding protein [Chloroflexaceae bacterium]|jgi:hypothetical protein|nr:DNA-binding protein [Chloroflexaceae bacterium]